MSDRNTRRDFFAASLLTASSAALVAGAPVGPPNILNENASDQNVEWRNKQPGMAYRRFGRSGLMISEVVSGGDPIAPNNYEHLNLALEMG